MTLNLSTQEDINFTLASFLPSFPVPNPLPPLLDRVSLLGAPHVIHSIGKSLHRQKIKIDSLTLPGV